MLVGVVERRYTDQLLKICVDLSNPQYIETFYTPNYRNFVAFVSRLLSLSEEEYSKVGSKLSFICDNSPIFHLELSKNESKPQRAVGHEIT